MSTSDVGMRQKRPLILISEGIFNILFTCVAFSFNELLSDLQIRPEIVTLVEGESEIILLPRSTIRSGKIGYVIKQWRHI